MDFEASPQQLFKVIEVGRTLTAISDPEVVRKRILEEAVQMLHAQTGSLFAIDDETGDLLFDVALGPAGAILKHAIRLKKGEGLAGSVADSGELEVVNDVPSDPRHAQRVGSMTGFSVQNAVNVPLKHGDTVIGVLQVLNKQATDISSDKFTKADAWFAETLGVFASIALETSKLRSAYEAELHAMTDMIATMAGLGDASVADDHGSRVSAIVRGVGARLGMDGRELGDLRIAAEIHDVGKLLLATKVPPADRAISDAEREALREHPRLGAELVARLPRYGALVAPAILHHHERFDGTGYPEGLAGEDIPLPARILAAADAFEIMTSEKAYGTKRDPKAALEELKAGAGQQHDPQVIVALSAAYKGGDLRHVPGLMPR